LRQLGLHRQFAGVEAGEQLGPAGVGIGELLRRPAVELVQPRADAAGGQSLSAQDGVELRGQVRHLLHAHAVNLVGRQVVVVAWAKAAA
jgi:hypothetical protein